MIFSNPITENEAKTTYDTLPEGWYTVQIVGEDTKQTGKGGTRLIYAMEVIAPQKYEGKKVWDSHNVICPGSSKAEQIARENLASCAKACGISNLTDSSQLGGKVLQVRVVITKDDGYEAKNEVKGYKKAEGYAPAQPQVQPPQAAPSYAQAPAGPAPSVGGSSVPPWQR